MLQVHPRLHQPHLRLGRPNLPTPPTPPSSLASQLPHFMSSSTLIVYAPFILPCSRSHCATCPLASLTLAFRLTATRRGGMPLAHASLKAAPMPVCAACPRRSACAPALIHMPRRVPAPQRHVPRMVQTHPTCLRHFQHIHTGFVHATSAAPRPSAPCPGCA